MTGRAPTSARAVWRCSTVPPGRRSRSAPGARIWSRRGCSRRGGGMRIALGLVIAALVLAAPASAQSPAPSVVAFTAGQTTPFTQAGATFKPSAGPRRSRRAGATEIHTSTLRLSLGHGVERRFRRAAGARRVVRARTGRRRAPDPRVRAAVLRRRRGRARPAQRRPRRTGRRSSSPPRTGATIHSAHPRHRPRGRSTSTTSRSRRPRRSPTRRSAPARRSRSSPTIRSAGRSHADSTAARRSRARARSRPAGLGAGAHTLSAAAVDVYGRADATPASAAFTVVAPVARTAIATGFPTQRQLPCRGQRRSGRQRMPTASATPASCSRPATCRRSRA